MSQRDVLDLVKKESRPLLAREIKQKLGLRSPATSANLKKLRESNLIGFDTSILNGRDMFVYYERKTTKDT